MALGPDDILACAAAYETPPSFLPARVTPIPPQHTNDVVVAGQGLPPGVKAPAFSLPTLDGGQLRLDDLRGRSVLLVFTDPDCPPCERLALKLERLQHEPAEREIVMISRGDAEASRAMASRHSFGFPVVIQQHWETSRAYGMLAVPLAYRIDEDGVLISAAAVGEEAVFELARRPEPTPKRVVSGRR
jgi:peroxiredoxin